MEVDQQAIYAEIENAPVEEKARAYFKSVPYHMRTREVKYGEDRNIHEEQNRGSGVGT